MTPIKLVGPLKTEDIEVEKGLVEARSDTAGMEGTESGNGVKVLKTHCTCAWTCRKPRVYNEYS